MSDLQALSDVQVVLLAARFISDVNIESLQVLAAERREVLTHDIIYRLLLALYPTDEAARSALLALLQSIRSDFDNVSQLDRSVDVSSVAALSPASIAREAAQLHLPPYQPGAFTSDDPFAIFLVSWAHYVEHSAGSLQGLQSLLNAFTADNDDLSRWEQTYLGPLVQLQYEFYPEDHTTLDLHQLETLSGPACVAALLQHASSRSEQAELARDLDQLVVPWITGRAEQSAWDAVNGWIFSTSQKDFCLSSKALLEWNGPYESTDDYFQDLAQTGFATIYASDDATEEHLFLARAIWQRAGFLVNIKMPDIASPYPDLGQTSAPARMANASFLQHTLMLKDNELTRVTDQSSHLLAGVLKTAEILGRYRLNTSIPIVAKVCLLGSQEQQQHELRRLLQQVPQMTSAESDWQQLRGRVLWLRTWGYRNTRDVQMPTYFGRLSAESVDTELLDAILRSDHFEKAYDIYIGSTPSPLELAVVEHHVSSAIYSTYDNASNGNRTRGGAKRAADILTVFRHAFPQSTEFRAVEHLLRATHSLSFYHLTLQHGVLFRPVNIRAQKDPLALIEKVLEQNQRSYAKLDDLVEIGRNLVLSGAGTQHVGEEHDEGIRVLEAEHRVTFAAVSSALASHDFDTAYSYITSRLLTSRTQSEDGFVDDTSWRAAYAAGRYRPSSPPATLHARISSLSKCMELLSLALTLAPSAEPLSEILGTWRRCEEEMDSLRTNALEEERAFEDRGNGEVPGGFGMDDRERDVADTRTAMANRSLARSATYEEEAPVGLFDMARGAATALRKNAFPLQGAAGGGIKIQNQASPTSGDFDYQEGERVRKRDMVSNMVTSGLVSGMGWVLGAQPAGKTGQQQ